MSIHPADDPSFRVGAEQNDALSVMTRLRASQAFESNEPTELDGAVEELIDKNLDQEKPDWSEVTRKVMRGVVESIADQDDADWAIRRASHRAVLAVATALLLIGRACCYGMLRRRPYAQRILIVGGGRLATALVHEITARPHLRWAVALVTDTAIGGGRPELAESPADRLHRAGGSRV